MAQRLTVSIPSKPYQLEPCCSAVDALAPRNFLGPAIFFRGVGFAIPKIRTPWYRPSTHDPPSVIFVRGSVVFAELNTANSPKEVARFLT